MSNSPSSHGTLPIGIVVAGRFRITGVVGKGAMGAVYAAEHCVTGQKVALKFMIVGDDDGDEFVRRFEQEARVMAGLKHPNTIRIYDFGRNEDGSLFMAMELLQGQGLDSRIREAVRQGTTLPEADVVAIGIQILRSLQEAHGQGLVHRDLKPGNVFLTDDGSGETLVKVLDFGIARVSDSSMTNAGRLMGTPSYMSPEQWQGSNKVDARSDLYAVGCILYACLTGRPPFQAKDNPFELMQKHMHEEPADPRSLARQPLSDAVVQVLATALAKQPDQRFSDAKAMRTALESAVGGAWAGTPAFVSAPVDPDATLAVPRAVVGASATRKRPLALIFAGVALVAAAAAAWLWPSASHPGTRPAAAPIAIAAPAPSQAIAEPDALPEATRARPAVAPAAQGTPPSVSPGGIVATAPAPAVPPPGTATAEPAPAPAAVPGPTAVADPAPAAAREPMAPPKPKVATATVRPKSAKKQELKLEAID